MSFILSIDQGTTGTTALLIDSKKLNIIDKINFEYTQHYPKPGWVEHDLDDIWHSVSMAVKELLDKNSINAIEIDAIGITNQRETTCAFNKSGKPLAKAIVWQDRRTSEFCLRLQEGGNNRLFKAKTGLPLDPYFSGTKINWLLKNNDAVKSALANDDLRVGTIDTYLLYKLTGNQSFKTDTSNASRTLLMDLQSSSWDDELCEILEVPQSILPEICDTFCHFGTTKGLSFLPDGIPITCLIGDQQSALFGQAGFTKGDMKCTYGTGAFLLLNTGTEIVKSENGLLSTNAFRHKGVNHYALEGSCYIAGAAVQWVRDNLNFIDSASAIEELSQSVKNMDEMKHILFMPFFSGLGSPFWNPEAKGAIIGLTRDTSRAHIARACLEGIALSIDDIITAFEEDSKHKIEELRVDGGATANNLLLSLQSTFSNLKIIRPEVIETTGYGAALGALVGMEKLSFNQISELWREDRNFTPDKTLVDYCQEKKIYWQNSVKKMFL